jgi:galactose mutarotase-like enzyme
LVLPNPTPPTDVIPANAGIHSLFNLPQIETLNASGSSDHLIPITLAEGTNGSRLSPG